MKYDILRRGEESSVKWLHMDQKVFSKEAIPLWVADMDIESPQEVTEAIILRAQKPHYGYTLPKKEAFVALQHWLSKRHSFSSWELSHFALSPSVISSLYHLVQLSTKEGEGVVITPPVYRPFFTVVQENYRHLYEEPLLYGNNDYHFNFEALDKVFSKSQTKAFILCHPHNPIGRIWTEEELKELAFLADKHSVFVISDEIHSDLIYGGEKHIPFHQVACEFPNLKYAVCYSPSKTFNLAGLATSAVYFSHKEMKKIFQETLEKRGIGSPNLLGLEAFTAAYSQGENWYQKTMSLLENNRNRIYSLFLKKGIVASNPQATYLMWVSLLNKNNSLTYEYFRDELHLVLDPGLKFGKEGEHFLRLNFALKEEVMDEVIHRLEKI